MIGNYHNSILIVNCANYQKFKIQKNSLYKKNFFLDWGGIKPKASHMMARFSH